MPDTETETETTDTETTEEAGTPTLEELQSQLKKRDRENAGLRGELKKREDAIKAHETAQMSEQEKLTARNKELEDSLKAKDQELSQTALRSATYAAAARLGFQDPEDGYRLINAADVVTDGEGRPTNLDELLQEVLKAKPYLGSGSTPPPRTGTSNPGPRGGTAKQGTDMNAEIRKRMGYQPPG